MDKRELLEKLRSAGYSRKTIGAFERVLREMFIPPEHKHRSYEDMPLPIGFNQTISQPSTIAFMLELLGPEPKQKIMEVGSGSGYVLALLAEIAVNADIRGTERIPELVERSREALADYDYVRVEYAPGGLGLPGKAPFDRILVSAAADSLPEELISQLADNGIMVCPVGNSIIKAVNSKNSLRTEEYPGFAFVKLRK